MQASSENEAEIYIYDEIGYWGVTAKQFVANLKALGDVAHIKLHINSPGGDVFDGIAIFNALKFHGAAITVYIDGLAASMASVIAMVGNPVIMPENTMMMIHKPWGFAGGDADDMRDYADLLDKVESVLIPAYAQKTGKSTEEIAAMLEEETWLSGTECLELGFADQVTPSLQAMACIHSKRIEEFEKMPNSIRNMVTPPRNTATRETQQPTATQPAPAAGASETDIRAQVIAEQKARVNGIQDLFAMFGGKHQELQAKCIADPECSVSQAKDVLLAELGKNATPSNTTTQGQAHVYAGNGNFVGDGIRQALMARAGYENVERDNVYNGMTLREYARMSLTERGIGVSSYNPMQMVGFALTHSTSDFGNILLDVANKALLQGWDEAAETFELWTKKGQLSDFKTAHRVGMGGFPSLRQVLNQLTDVPMKMGRAAKATIGDLVYAVLTGNGKLSDGKALFHADHANLSAGAISVDSLDKARQNMRKQKEGERALNIRPAYMLVPVGLETLASQTIKSASVKGADINAGVVNPLQNFAEVIAEARLDDADPAAWYLAAAQGTDTIEVAYLNGIDAPYIDQQEGFTTDGVATKVRIDAGVAPLDYRGLAKSSGK